MVDVTALEFGDNRRETNMADARIDLGLLGMETGAVSGAAPHE